MSADCSVDLDVYPQPDGSYIVRIPMVEKLVATVLSAPHYFTLGQPDREKPAPHRLRMEFVPHDPEWDDAAFALQPESSFIFQWVEAET